MMDKVRDPDKEWNDLGTLEIEAKHNISISGKEVNADGGG